MTLTYFLIFSLATWRISSLLVREDGPFFVFRKLREITGIEHDDEGDIFMIPETFFAGLLSCVWCCSVWVALGWWLFWLVSPDLAAVCAVWPAISGGALIVEARKG